MTPSAPASFTGRGHDRYDDLVAEGLDPHDRRAVADADSWLSKAVHARELHGTLVYTRNPLRPPLAVAGTVAVMAGVVVACWVRKLGASLWNLRLQQESSL